jgi:DNA-binding NarL/FixJ family response regulator
MSEAKKVYKVLIVEEDIFIQKLISEVISNLGHKCQATSNVNDALIKVKSFSPDLVITDLDFGSAPTGLDLLHKLDKDYPEIKLVVLTAHTSHALVDSSIKILPSRIQYIVKSDFGDEVSFDKIIQNAFEAKPQLKIQVTKPNNPIYLSNTQAELLKLVSQGLSNQAIAEKRGTSLRAVEALINRTYQALKLSENDSINLRVEAVKLWKSSRIYLK